MNPYKRVFTPAATQPARTQTGAVRTQELRLYGINAVRAVFAQQPDDLRKLYLSQARVDSLRDVLKWCAANKRGYRIVDEDDLRKLAASAHHEGVVADVRRPAPLTLAQWLSSVPTDAPACALWLDGIGNPHNLGAILRNAAHFGVAGILQPAHSGLALSGAAARVAEGGAVHVPLVQLGTSAVADMQLLHEAGFCSIATVVRGGAALQGQALPARVLYVLGAEQDGVQHDVQTLCQRVVSIAGTGRVESLNVASATAVLLAAWAGQARTV